jgi:hypothetical protein
MELNRGNNRSSKYQVGAAFVEFLMVFAAVIMPITIATLNIGKILWQTQALSDMARESVRIATIQSDRDKNLNCTQITQFAEVNAWQSLQSNTKWNLSTTWYPTVYMSSTRVFRANNSSFGAPEARIKMINVLFSTNEDKTCLLCAGDLVRKLNIWVFSNMDINSNSICAQS